MKNRSGWFLFVLATMMMLFGILIARYQSEPLRWSPPVAFTTILFLVFALSSCGGGGSSGTGGGGSPGTQAGSYTITVSATSGSGSNAATRTATLTLVVQ
jgi:hypothetical protein